MGDLNRDRFGESIETKAAKLNVPGPGSYNPMLPKVKNNQSPSFSIANHSIWPKSKNPGPAYYDPIIAEKRTNFKYSNAE